jgi:hypothetical protein
MFSTGLNSGAREGRQIGVTLAGIFSSGVVCQSASRQHTRCAEIDDERGLRAGSDGARDFVDVKLYRLGVGEGSAEAAPLPWAGQIAPNS